MKLDYCIIILGFLSLLLLAIVGISNPVASFNRPLFAICMDLCVITFIIGYNHEINKKRTISEKALALERIREYLKGIK